MTVNELAQNLHLTVRSGGDGLENQVSGCYIGDLLSLAMSKVQRGDVWITIQTNLNVVAVASLTEAACVLVPEGIAVEQETVERATEQGIVLLQSEESAFSLACALQGLV